MASSKINVLVSSISGLNLPSTIVIPLDRESSGNDIWDHISQRIPIDFSQRRYILSTHTNTTVSPTARIASYLSDAEHGDLLSLRLWSPLCGGKGGFGSQLRAAGGRMSSKKKHGQPDDNGSSRNLDGRRLRTVNEAKALAEYLAVKPEMDKRQKELRTKRLEQVVEMAERRTEEIKNGTKGRIDEKWLESRNEASERTRNAVFAVMKDGVYKDNLLGTSHGSVSSAQPEEGSSDEEAPKTNDSSDSAESEPEASPSSPPLAAAKDDKPKTFFGFDEDDEFMSSDEEVDG
ncbi:hypothetical protein TD95_005064 [Thielaviopsis punctulata]|uniref:Uncharacterized protein n=1 Tax=Thielaviopsis punctulata TaxID=72032 RepID=A0A0F4ZKS8_9PEZI|nr:hypothetical protein TD95_005064 [Thielaviopsis punctulata]